eukprot:gnl/MRDRNA2_/MRDRNA2_77094_c0_seq1.p1 gnl/MRDRNA2_/MRDRNA2_77094_c0~~gnl/MRDRNA2_/MRDRNA2_77094_c0_seq1.p1  ORF type:complete len:264 (+),score=21.51 gnl/MRDRNA2_/MRDRNA2_77094_c0_seq1:293-1084(+)
MQPLPPNSEALTSRINQINHESITNTQKSRDRLPELPWSPHDGQRCCCGGQGSELQSLDRLDNGGPALLHQFKNRGVGLPDIVGGFHTCVGKALLVGPGPVLCLDVAHSLLRDHRLHDLFPPSNVALNISGIFWSSRIRDLNPLLPPNSSVDEPTMMFHHVENLTPPAILTILLFGLGRSENSLEADNPVRNIEVYLDIFQVFLTLQDVSEVEGVPEETSSVGFDTDWYAYFFLDGESSAEEFARLLDAPRVTSAVGVDDESS